MFKQNLWEDLNKKISEVMAQSPAKDIEKNMRAMMAGVFTKMDLVTREEFDVQTELLKHTREKLIELETKLATVEGRQPANPSEPPPPRPPVIEV
ncbi:MAG: accessory factor UbiK family protein [Burkholderiales bacterium]|nr:accessory factor UbiK family protein [Burkholderiales bacterium]MDQ3196869.1 accessory factor UbiK family protein [Pseudomonadota bacterium]